MVFSLRSAFLGLLVSLSLLFPVASFAQPIAPCPASPCYGGSFTDGIDAAGSNLPLEGNLDINEVVLRIINFILDVILIIAVLAIIVAGVYLIVSNGDDAQKEKAKKIVMYVVIGIILILFSRAIVILVNNTFGAS
jgi:hypothetical protein